MSTAGPPPSPRAPSPVSFPPIEEKVEEEERAAEETARCPPSPLAHYYSSLTLSDRYAWPHFLGDWAFEDGQPRRGEYIISVLGGGGAYNMDSSEASAAVADDDCT